MNQETLDKAYRISQKLELLRQQRTSWEKANMLAEGIYAFMDGYSGQQCLKTEHVPFDTVKVLTLSVIDEKINKLQSEFASL